MTLNVQAYEGSATFAVRVQPAAKRTAVVGWYGDGVKIALNAPAVDGKANEALVRFLADLLGIPRLSIAIASGHTSRSKVIRVVGVAPEELRQRLTPIQSV